MAGRCKAPTRFQRSGTLPGRRSAHIQRTMGHGPQDADRSRLFRSRAPRRLLVRGPRVSAPRPSGRTLELVGVLRGWAHESGPTILFHSRPEPKTTKNRVHLDVWIPREESTGHGTAHVEAEAARLLLLGATRIRTRDEDGDFYIVMQDPEGNEFCIA